MKALFAIAAVVFFATPVAARVVGVKAEPFENRRLAEAPSLDDGWNVFDRATRFLTDRMPLREEAVRANTRISQDLFDTTPRYGEGDGRGLPFAGSGGRGPQVRNFDGFRVATGRDGWLYLADEPDRACTLPSPATPRSGAGASSRRSCGTAGGGPRSWWRRTSTRSTRSTSPWTRRSAAAPGAAAPLCGS